MNEDFVFSWVGKLFLENVTLRNENSQLRKELEAKNVQSIQKQAADMEKK